MFVRTTTHEFFALSLSLSLSLSPLFVVVVTLLRQILMIGNMLRSDVLVFAALWVFFLAAYSVLAALIMEPTADRTMGYEEEDNAGAVYAKLVYVRACFINITAPCSEKTVVAESCLFLRLLLLLQNMLRSRLNDRTCFCFLVSVNNIIGRCKVT